MFIFIQQKFYLPKLVTTTGKLQSVNEIGSYDVIRL